MSDCGIRLRRAFDVGSLADLETGGTFEGGAHSVETGSGTLDIVKRHMLFDIHAVACFHFVEEFFGEPFELVLARQAIMPSRRGDGLDSADAPSVLFWDSRALSVCGLRG